MSFSERHNIQEADPEITIKYEAPKELRSFVCALAIECGLWKSTVITTICAHYAVIKDEELALELLYNTFKWNEIYDLIEEFFEYLTKWKEYEGDLDLFQYKINRFFYLNGIGWQFLEGKIIDRGSEDSTISLSQAIQSLNEQDYPTAAREMQEARNALSRRPEPNITGAINHAIAALECTARSLTGDKGTLGKLLSNKKDFLPPTISEAIEKLWGFASDQSRHVKEGKVPEYSDAALSVHIASAVTTYLLDKFKNNIQAPSLLKTDS